MLLLAALGVFVAGGSAVLALCLRTFNWFSDSEWIKDKYLNDVEMLRRYRVATMFNVRRSHEVVSGKKTAWIVLAQWAFAFAGLSLLASLVAAIWPHPLATLLNSIRVWGI